MSRYIVYQIDQLNLFRHIFKQCMYLGIYLSIFNLIMCISFHEAWKSAIKVCLISAPDVIGMLCYIIRIRQRQIYVSNNGYTLLDTLILSRNVKFSILFCNNCGFNFIEFRSERMRYRSTQLSFKC